MQFENLVALALVILPFLIFAAVLSYRNHARCTSSTAKWESMTCGTTRRCPLLDGDQLND